MLTKQRHLLIASQMQRALGEILTQLWAQEDPTLLNISKVEVSSDLSLAKVYYNFWPQDNVKQNIGRFSRHHREIARRLRGSIRLRVVPKLVFIYDSRADKAEELMNLLDRLKDDEGNNR